MVVLDAAAALLAVHGCAGWDDGEDTNDIRDGC